MKHTHSDKLERWLGADVCQRLSQEFKNFYWPVQLNGVPGKVYVAPGGDFIGEIAAGSFMSKKDSYAESCKRLLQKAEKDKRIAAATLTLIEAIKAENSPMAASSVGAFSSLGAVIAAATGGKLWQCNFSKTGAAANAIGNSNDLWVRAGSPPAGAAAAASPGGTAFNNSSTGSLAFKSLGTANTTHYLNWSLQASVINNSLLLYDRLWGGAKTMNSTAAENYTGVPTRYQNTSSSAVDYIGGNFLFPSNPTTVLAATAHNWTGTYVDDAGAAQSFASIAGVSACVVSGVDLAVGNWFVPLAASTLGIKNLTQVTCSAAVATGTIDFIIGHPIVVNSCPIANIACLDDGVYTSLNLAHIEDNCCLAFLELTKPATTATTYSGIIRTVAE